MAYAHTKFAQQIQFTIEHLADFDSAYFSESESVKLVYITDIARFTRLETRLINYKLKCNLQTTSLTLSWTMQVGDHGLLPPDTRFTAVTNRFRDALSFGKVYPPIWLRQSDTVHLPDISISSPKRPV